MRTVRRKLDEVSRKQLLVKNRVQDPTRYNKRMNYKVTKYDQVNIPELFENDYFIFNNQVNDHYTATIAFHGVMSELKSIIKNYNDFKRINLQMVIKALNRAFDKADDVQVDCDCPDFKYTFSYVATKHGYKYGEPENRIPKKRNPNDDKGATCKHLSGMLSDKGWMTKAASYINKWIKAYPEEALEYLLPDYEEKLRQRVIDKTDETGEEYNNIYDRQRGDDFDYAQVTDEGLEREEYHMYLSKSELNEVVDLIKRYSKNKSLLNGIKSYR